MSLDVNGYNDAFNAFANFARAHMDAGCEDAVARGRPSSKALRAGAITAATTDRAYAITRSSSDKLANDVTRSFFRASVADMFGGEDKIPASVKKAMELGDYGGGKPLTARRIIAVKNAIDEDGTARMRASLDRQRRTDANRSDFLELISTFKYPKNEAAALAKGYARAELPKLAAATALYAAACGCSEAEALEVVSTPDSNANRLMNYGGSFMDSLAGFANGLLLLDSFSSWFDQTAYTLKTINSSGGFVDGMTKTVLNGSTAYITELDKRGFEKFVFEELANNPPDNLLNTGSESAFGMENNAAMRFLGRGFHTAQVQTLAQIPPERRPTFFAAFDTLTPLFASNAEQANVRARDRNDFYSSNACIFTSRILKNLDRIEVMHRSGHLNAENVVKLCFPEIKKIGDNPVAAVNKLCNQWRIDMGIVEAPGKEPRFPIEYCDQIMMMLETTGCGPDEAYEAVLGRKQIPLAPFVSTGSLGLQAFDGTASGRNQLIADLVRHTNYFVTRDGAQAGLLPESGNVGFKAAFPDGQSFLTDASENGRANANAVCDKVEALCGVRHPLQACNVMMMMSQSGLARVKDGLLPIGVKSDEHSPVDMALSRDSVTGDVTITYSSPKELPFAFTWTATVKTDGTTTTTPFRFVSAERNGAIKAAVPQMLASIVRRHPALADKRAEVAKAIETILMQAGEDQDVFELLKHENVCRELMINASAGLNSSDLIVANVDKLLANVAEVRAAAKGDDALAKAAVKALCNFGGKPVPAGVISKIFAAAKIANIDKLQKLKGSSSAKEFHAAMRQFVKALYDISGSTGFHSLPNRFGSAYGDAFNMLVATILASRCGASTLEAMKAGFSGVNAAKVLSVYKKVGNGAYSPREWDGVMKARMPALGASLTDACGQFAAGIAYARNEAPVGVNALDVVDELGTPQDILTDLVDFYAEITRDL